MCDPGTIGIISTLMSAGGSIMQASAQKRAADANAEVAMQNANLARQQAEEVQRQKAREETILAQKEQQVLGQQRVAMAGSGTSPTEGSGLNILQSTAYQAGQDVNAMEWNAANQEWQLKSQAVNYENQAESMKAQGKNAMTAGILSAGATIGAGAYNLMGGTGIQAKQAATPTAQSGLMDVSKYSALTDVSNRWRVSRNPNTYGIYGFGR